MIQSRLNENQIELIETSFAALAPKGAALVGCCYERLLREHPKMKRLFPGAGQHQQQKQLLAGRH